MVEASEQEYFVVGRCLAVTLCCICHAPPSSILISSTTFFLRCLESRATTNVGQGPAKGSKSTARLAAHCNHSDFIFRLWPKRVTAVNTHSRSATSSTTSATDTIYSNVAGSQYENWCCTSDWPSQSYKWPTRATARAKTPGQRTSKQCSWAQFGWRP